MIPKIIHYCWFGGNPLPEEAKKCIASWKKYFPFYEIKEWNESNYDLNVCNYVREAYEKKKWAFVSDYARFDILYKYGGLYFDTDVEVIRPMDDIIAQGGFMGLENGDLETLVEASLEIIKDGSRQITSGIGASVAPGLGIAVAPGLRLYKDILEGYHKRHFVNEDGYMDTYTVCDFVTGYLLRNGITIKEGIAYSSGIKIYPKDYFCPKDAQTGYLNITDNTRSIHHYSATWVTPLQQKIYDIERKYMIKYGKELGYKKSRKATLIYRILNKLKSKGVIRMIRFVGKKFIR